MITRLLFLPTLGWNVLLGRILRLRHWWDPVDDRVILGALPFPKDVASLLDEGVTGVVNMCLEYRGPCEAYAEAGIEQLHVPTLDFTPPTLGNVERAVQFIADHAGKDGKVYVHCKAGRGRSATVVMCWLIESQQMSPQEAQSLILQKRKHANRHLAQRQVVQDFFRSRRQQSG